MRYAVIGGDVRFAHLVGMLKEGGWEAAGFLQEKAGGENRSLAELKRYSCIISNWPMRWPMSDTQVSEAEVLENIAPGSVLLLCGPKFPRERRWDLQYINLWEDETLLRENAWLTAEGAAAAAMRRLGIGFSGLNCVVVGYGRIGRVLCRILRNQGANVTVISSQGAKRSEAKMTGAQAVGFEGLATVLPQARLVFSTPPAMVIDRKLLEYANPETMIIDLASPPYGVDLDAAHEMGLQAWREPGLPGRFCPLSAARAIYNAVLRWEEAEIDG